MPLTRPRLSAAVTRMQTFLSFLTKFNPGESDIFVVLCRATGVLTKIRNLYLFPHQLILTQRSNNESVKIIGANENLL